VVVQLADLLGAFGGAVAAGDLVICGSKCRAPFIGADETEFSYTLGAIATFRCASRADRQRAGI